MRRKKDIERIFLDEARRVSSLIPRGDFEPRERPDFLLQRSPSALGIEVTELCRQDARAAGARHSYVSPEAKKLYDKRAYASPVFVNFGLSQKADGMTVKELSAGLADFVYTHRDNYGNFSWDEQPFPTGFFQIGISSPNEAGTWFHSAGFETTLVGADHIQACISAKNARLADYRKTAPEVWLLIVNSLFLGAGEVCVRADEITESTFEFAFDKVLLFERQPGGSGKVFELSARCVAVG